MMMKKKKKKKKKKKQQVPESGLEQCFRPRALHDEAVLVFGVICSPFSTGKG